MVYNTMRDQMEWEESQVEAQQRVLRSQHQHDMQRQQQSQGPAIAKSQLTQLMNELGAAEAALNVSQDALLEAATRASKLDAITNTEAQLSEAELIRQYPALEA